MGHIPALDGIRGVAILMVVLCHLAPAVNSAKHGFVQVVARMADQGAIGVDLFFVLSGFLITGILLRSKSSPRFFVNFYGRRAVRIFPLYYFFLTLIAIGLFTIPAWKQYQNLRDHWPSYWFYGTNFLIARYGWGILGQKAFGLGYLWSLAVEEHFTCSGRSWSGCSPSPLIRVCLVIIVIAPVTCADRRSWDWGRWLHMFSHHAEWTLWPPAPCLPFSPTINRPPRFCAVSAGSV